VSRQQPPRPAGLRRLATAAHAWAKLITPAGCLPARPHDNRRSIPPWHAASLRVAAKLGMPQTGTAQDDEAGDVLVFELP
jgi:hypothetical protein